MTHIGDPGFYPAGRTQFQQDLALCAARMGQRIVFVCHDDETAYQIRLRIGSEPNITFRVPQLQPEPYTLIVDDSLDPEPPR